MLDTRSGQLLTSQSFKDAFSHLQFAEGGVSYLLHKSTGQSEELIELHHLDLTTNADTLITHFTHAPQTKIRPSLWRGSLSADSSLLVYQPDVLTPNIRVVDAKLGTTISQIRWDEDLSPLSVHIDQHNEQIAIPLAKWDARYSYGPILKLFVADLKTGVVLGKYDVAHSISHVRFEGKHVVLIDSSDRVGHLDVGSPDITWKQMQKGTQHLYYANDKMAGLFSRTGNDQPGEFHLLTAASKEQENRFSLEKGFNPVGLRGNMLVSEKQSTPELPTWLQKVNERFVTLCGRYLVSPLTHELRYQDATTGELLTQIKSEERSLRSYVSHRASGTTRVATIYYKEDHLGVEFAELFPFWTARTIALLAAVITSAYCYFRKRRTSFASKACEFNPYSGTSA